jgi:hypothetical protein
MTKSTTTDMSEWINARLVLPGVLSTVALFVSRDRAALATVLNKPEQRRPEASPEAHTHVERISR